MKNLAISCLFLATCHFGFSQAVSLETDTGIRTRDAFIGASTEFMYSIMRGVANQAGTAYETAWPDSGVLDELLPLQLHHLRFPGGTVSQYYHFRGNRGYGTIPEDLECREGFIHLPNMIQKVSTDAYYPQNLIGSYRTMAERGGAETPVQTLYVLNLMSHFFHGDLAPFNAVMDEVIAEHAAELGPYLSASPRFLDTARVSAAVSALQLAFQDDRVADVRYALLQQPGFQFRVADNLDAVNFLLTNNLPVTGIELGNENFAYTMLKDDDLSEFPYDCTTPDSIVYGYGAISLPTKAYLQAILKYAIVSEIYADIFHLNTDIPVGGVLTPNEFRVEFLTLDSFEILPSGSERARYYELWNGFIGNLDFFDALMPHFYMNSIPECPTFDGLSADSITLFGKHYLDFYFTDILPNQLQTIRRQVSDKPLWITEWNINTANLFGNTFFHASHCFRFMNFMNAHQREYGIDLVNYHNLSAWNYNQFALIRTEDVDSVFTVNRQAMYYPFMLMGELHQEQPFVATADMAALFGHAASSPEHYYQAYTSPENDALIVHFINLSEHAVEADLTTAVFAHSHPGGEGGPKEATGAELRLLNAGSIFSSDRGCDAYPQYFDTYTWETASYDRETVALPPYSLGVLRIGLSQVVAIPENQWRGSVHIHPNPADDYISLSLPDDLRMETEHVIFRDIAGKTLQVIPLHSGNIPTALLPPGYYLLTLAGESGKTLYTEKLVISRK